MGQARRFLRGRRGSVAVEFAILVGPFFVILFSCFEVGWFYFANSRVDAVTLDAARLIRTGTVSNGNVTADQFFRDVICPPLSIFGNCNRLVTVEVEEFRSFTALRNDTRAIACRNDAQQKIDDLRFNTGTENSIIRVRICLLHKSINPAVGVRVAGADGFRRLTTEFVFRSEPFLRNQRRIAGAGSTPTPGSTPAIPPVSQPVTTPGPSPGIQPGGRP